MMLHEIAGLAGENAAEGWMNTRWRPMIAWQYMMVCIFDFLLAPMLWAFFQVIFLHVGMPGAPALIPWSPITLQGGGLYHLAMGAIVSTTAWGRMKEKMGAIDAINNGTDNNK